MEANPGTTEHYPFDQLLKAGVNRLSLGVQSFNDQALHRLGRIHKAAEAHHAIESAKQSGFSHINIDLMYGLPSQTFDQALQDLTLALEHETTHLSWYQLTIEPHTAFYYR